MGRKIWNLLVVPKNTQARIKAYVQQWGHNMTSNIHTRLRKSDGYFLPACYIHVGFSKDGPFIEDPKSGKEYTYAEAFGKWHSNLGSMEGASGFRLEDACG